MTTIDGYRNVIIAIIANHENAEFCTSFDLITDEYGTEVERKVAAFLFQNEVEQLSTWLNLCSSMIRKMKREVATSIREAGGDHDSYLTHVKRLLFDQKLKRDLGLRSLSIPSPDSLPPLYGYNRNGEVGFFHHLRLNAIRKAFIDAARACNNFLLENPGASSHSSCHRRRYKSFNATTSRWRKELRDLTANIAVTQQLFEADSFRIQDILLATVTPNSERVQVIEAQMLAIEKTSAAQALSQADSQGELMPFITPDLQDGVLRSNLSTECYERLRHYQDLHAQCESFTGGTTAREKLYKKRRYHGRVMMKSMLKHVCASGEVLFDLSKLDAVNFMGYVGAKHEEAEADLHKRYYKDSDEEAAALAQYHDITKKLVHACTPQEIAKLEQEVSQVWNRTGHCKSLQKVTIGSCSYVDLLNDTVNHYKLRRIVKG
eukprot:scaffold11579_cov80-Skeletonema_menzelii.AAC.1